MNRGWLLLPFALMAAGFQDPQAEYDTKLRDIYRGLAAGHANIGEYLAGAQMHKWGREEFKKAIDFDPDCEKARKKMGYKKEGNEWVFDPGLKLETSNKKSGPDADRIRGEYDKKLTSLGKDYAKKFVDLAAWCDKNSLKDLAVENYKRAVEYDPGNEKARKALGFEKLPKGGWIGPYEKELRKEMKEGLAKAPKGNASTTALDVEKGLGVGLTKQESEHFIVASPVLAKGALEVLIQHAEHAYAMWHKIFGQKNLFEGNKLTFLILKDKTQHEAFIDRFHQGNAAQKDLAKKSAGSLGFPLTECYQGDRDQGSLEDYVVHATTQLLQGFFSVGQASQSHNPIWLTEGMAYYFTRVMKDTAAWG
jgi:hypothetical protein